MYRTRFSEFLKIDFLIIIFADPVKKFEKISKLGMSLIDAQILKDTIKLDNNIGMSKFIPFERYICKLEIIVIDKFFFSFTYSIACRICFSLVFDITLVIIKYLGIILSVEKVKN
ncbi:hypothetical protein O5405_04355 (plasmid) [Borrelia miyamotoi]|uniref:Type ISP restriction-modification enzyme LLaBIII C-terminal specificity domain-containing protein n=1 Tax=Borrelia miyamotoi TaxID=47466 RepID=A0AAQ2WWW8_9SPIR|nr:type ISP restriction/modification enzyme [Borrelia miyamotoi]WAZ85701.1 hypothetical protein O5400_04360 [Borrelia miyamotoi]WAZ91482.1 hypothetical protein O5398_04360 [Borrelia miyamotoi]WAZ92771.1 hypothetical protein O5402_04360 [Borrelia miyamotoi]WAZ94062.1 hypothetical protein O5399_04365 [Borrelia miyamotoi]WAZ95351.1 hypothetical protein O5397_04355 [Borrelia miyamotoi]